MKTIKYQAGNVYKLNGASGKYGYCHPTANVKMGDNSDVMIQVCDKDWNPKPNTAPALMPQSKIGSLVL